MSVLMSGWSASWYILPFLLILSVVVFFHELGHFLIGRWCGVKVEIFSGFGPELFGFNDRHETHWRIAALPLGGYVKFHGAANGAMTPDDAFLETVPAHERAGSFSTQKIWKRAAIVAAGPIANFMLAIAIYTGTFYAHGRSILVPVVDSVTKDSAAEAAGFQPGDRIVSVGGKKIDSFEDMQRIVDAAAGTQLQFIVDRSGQFVELAATPRRRNIVTSFGSARVAVIGVESKAKPENSRIQTYDLAKSVELAVSETCYVVARTGRYIRGLVSGEESAGQLSGPIRIAEVAGEMVKIGVAALLNLAAVLSISVGMLNLLPIPVLDGGHLAYYAVEAIRGRAMNEKAQQFGINVGIVLIMSLMCFAAYNDILHLAQRSLHWE